MKINLTREQVEVLAPLWAAKLNAERQWRAAMTLMGVGTLTGGDFEADPPYLLTADVETVETVKTSFVGDTA